MAVLCFFSHRRFPPPRRRAEGDEEINGFLMERGSEFERFLVYLFPCVMFCAIRFVNLCRKA